MKKIFAIAVLAAVLCSCEKPDKPETLTSVDLGLSVKWASCNVGATTYTGGDQFAWGEIATKADYTWDTYKYASFDETLGYQLGKYNTTAALGTVDGLDELAADDDPATALLGANWRTPTIDEWDELMSYCDWKWETNENGVKGYRVTSLVDGYTENSIFLPVTGSYYKKELKQPESGYYWTSSQGSQYAAYFGGDDTQAFYIYLSATEFDYYLAPRFYGRAIRAVEDIVP